MVKVGLEPRQQTAAVSWSRRVVSIFIGCWFFDNCASRGFYGINGKRSIALEGTCIGNLSGAERWVVEVEAIQHLVVVIARGRWRLVGKLHGVSAFKDEDG